MTASTERGSRGPRRQVISSGERGSRGYRAPALGLLALATVAGACGDSPTEAGPASLEVTASTSGEDIDADGYTLVVDGEETRAMGVDETITSRGVPPGRYVLELTDVANNCTVQGDNPRTLRVTGDATASTTFEVVCSGRTGDLTVEAETTGEDRDADGYTVTVDGTRSRSVGSNGTVTYEDLAAGEHEVQLSGVANNCTVQGENPRSASVPFEGTAEVTFAVECTDAVGDLVVSVETTGEDRDDEYTVELDGGAQDRVVDANGQVTFTDVAAGDHQVELTEVAGNCSVDGERRRNVTVPNDGRAETAFSVTCSLAVGDLVVSAETTGDDEDDGYTVTVDGDQRDLAPDGEVTFAGIPAGDHQVELGDVADNCSVDGSNPRTVTVPNGGSAGVTFQVECSERTGDLEVSASTSGDDQDDDGYTVTVDPGTADEDSRSIGANGTVTFEDLSAGDHQVELGDVADNCTVQGDNPRTVTVPEGGTATTTFDVECSAVTGDLEVSASTTGDDQDDDGYTVEVDGSQTRSIGANGTVTFEDLSAGDHQVELTGVASNCTVQGDNPRTVTVPEGGTATTTFDVECSAVTGDLEVSASTTGDDQDDDGYTVTVDPGTADEDSRSIGANGTVTFEDLSAGDHQVELGDVADNCSVDGDNPRTVTVPEGGTATTTFDVTCNAVTGDLTVATETEGDDQDDGYVAEVDGGTRSEPIGADDAVTFEEVQAGDHQVELGDVAENCEVDDENPRTVTVPQGGEESTEFEVECVAETGSLRVTASTTGDEEDIDDDGYVAVLDPRTGDRESDRLEPNGDEVLFGDVTTGDHQVALTDVASNCTIDDGEASRTVAVQENETVTEPFELSCDPPAEES